MAEDIWFNSISTQGKVICLIIFSLIIVCMQFIIRSFHKGDGAMKKNICLILELLQAFNINIVAGATLSLR